MFFFFFFFFFFFLLIITGDCHLLIADNVVLPAFCAKTYRLRSTIDVQNGISKVSVELSLALLINREALADTAKYFMRILDRRGNLWVKSMDSGGVEETT